MTAKSEYSRYGFVAVTLHWVIAGAILYMIWLGTYMTDAEDYKAYQLHKSLGITILALSLLRLIWRFVDPPPPLPSGMSRLERFGAHASHFAFYALMIGVPLGGWALASTNTMVETKVWDLFTLPRLPGLAGLPPEQLEDLGDTFEDMHEFFGLFGFLALLALHVLAALKHHFWNRDNVLTRMIPFLPSPRK